MLASWSDHVYYDDDVSDIDDASDTDDDLTSDDDSLNTVSLPLPRPHCFSRPQLLPRPQLPSCPQLPSPPPLPKVEEEALAGYWLQGAESFTVFLCPILHEVMTDPVTAADGHTYERSAICRWFERSRKSPVTGQALTSTELVPNHSVRTLLKTLIDMSIAGRPSPCSCTCKASNSGVIGRQTHNEALCTHGQDRMNVWWLPQPSTAPGCPAGHSPPEGAVLGSVPQPVQDANSTRQSAMQRHAIFLQGPPAGTVCPSQYCRESSNSPTRSLLTLVSTPNSTPPPRTRTVELHRPRHGLFDRLVSARRSGRPVCNDIFDA